jgi:hypothetical protein
MFMSAKFWPVDDEIAHLLAALRALAARASSPVVRACLEEAVTDIAHLTGTEAGSAEIESQPEAA